MAWTSHIVACPPQSRAEALEILYRRVPDSLRPYLVAEVLEEARAGIIDLSSLWIAVRGLDSEETRKLLDPGSPSTSISGRILGAMLTQPITTKTAAVWAPEVRPSWRRNATAAALVRAALESLKSKGFRIAQAVLDESSAAQGSQDLSRGGFPKVTELVYMERLVEIPPQSIYGARSANPSPWTWCPFNETNEADFRIAMQATYCDSLDMPELGGSRSIDDIIADHRSARRFEPMWWRLGRIENEPDCAAILLLAKLEGVTPESWEVVYLGLTPAARGRGLGRQVIAHALELAVGNVARLELAVDVRNIPALKLYQSTGFTIVDRRIVHLAIFND